MASEDQVTLRLPADPEFLRLARVTASGLASRVGFTFDEIDDLRLAIDELCLALIGKGERPGVLELRYSKEPDALVVDGEAHFEGAVPRASINDWSRQILTALVDEHELDVHGKLKFHLRKRHTQT